MLKINYTLQNNISGEMINEVHELKAMVLFNKVQEFEEMINSDESVGIFQALSTSYTQGDTKFIVDFFSHFQFGTEQKLSKDAIAEFIGMYLVNSKTDIYDLYEKIIAEFDISGVIKRDMGKSLVKVFTSKMKEVMNSMESPTEDIAEDNS